MLTRPAVDHLLTHLPSLTSGPSRSTPVASTPQQTPTPLTHLTAVGQAVQHPTPDSSFDYNPLNMQSKATSIQPGKIKLGSNQGQSKMAFTQNAAVSSTLPGISR